MRLQRPKYALSCKAPIAQLAEAADLKSVQCRFESDWGHGIRAGRRTIGASGSAHGPVRRGVVAGACQQF
jgi:hypothetical protein